MLQKIIILLFIFIIQFSNAQQRFLTSAKYSEIVVDNLNDSEIFQIIQELKNFNLGILEFENLAVSNGMDKIEFEKLKEKIIQKEPNLFVNEAVTKNTITNQKKDSIINPKNEIKFSPVTIFGSEIFSNENLKFEPNFNAPPPSSYVLGYGDELLLNVYGQQILNHTATISVNGTVDIPLIGEIYLNGISFEAANHVLKQKLAKVYKSLLSGKSNLSVTLTKLRSINVTIIGAKRPGTYTLSSLSTIFNALYACGGPDENGTYRRIQVLRNNKLIREIDLYKFLINGDQSDNIALKDNDVIKIPVYQNRVRIEGEVKRPGIFELIEKENFNLLLTYCSGFKDEAYKSFIKLKTITDKDIKILNLSKQEFDVYYPNSGDLFTVGRVSDRIQNRVSINGAIYRPDEYELTESLSVSKLIQLADGLREDAFTEQAQLIRQKNDLSQEIIQINLKKALEGDHNHDITLKREDQLKVFSILEFKEKFIVKIEGQILKPGEFEYIEGISLYDLILQAGGLGDGASDKIEIARMIKSNQIDLSNTKSSEIIQVNCDKDFEQRAKALILQPFDIVKVRKKPVFEVQQNVLISGSVVYPGNYTISDSKETVLNIINRAGGLKPDADIKAIKIKRQEDLITEAGSTKRIVNVPINYNKIIRFPNSKENVTLHPGDEIIITKYSDVVKILGEVNLASEIPYKKGKSTRHYINAAGGFKDNKSKKDIYVIHSNGYASRTHNFLFFKNYPQATPGCEIVIPKKIEKVNRTSTGEIVAISSVLGSFAGITIAVLNFTKK